MAKYLRNRPSPSMVVSMVALIVAMGGTGYAAIALPKNSVGTKQLKKNAVTGSKIKKNAVTGSKVKDGSLTGADISAGTIGKVPAAANADHAATADNATNAGHAGAADSATNATNATNAGNANTVGGVTVKKILFNQASGSGTDTTILDLGGLKIIANCSATSQLTLTAKSTVDHAEIHAHPLAGAFDYNFTNTDSGGDTFTDFSGGTTEREDDNFNVADSLDIADETNTGTDSMSGLVFYAAPNGSAVNVQYMAEESAMNGNAACLVSGFAMAG